MTAKRHVTSLAVDRFRRHPYPRFDARNDRRAVAVAVIGSFNSRPEAELAAGMLEGNGIPATVLGDDAGGTAGVNLSAAGYRLAVPDDRHAEAAALLEPAIPADEPATAAASDQPGRSLAVQVIAFLVLAVVIFAAISALLD